MGWLPGWKYRYPFSVSNTYISASLTDFPLLVYLANDSKLSNALATGYDIRFTQSDGTTLCGYERSLWSGGGGSAGTLAAYMKAPSLSSSASTSFFMYLGKADASDVASNTAAWDDHHKAVYHLQESGFNYADSISAVNLTTGDAPTRTAGVYGYAQGFNGTSNYLQGADTNLPAGAGDRTISCLLAPSSTANRYAWDYGTAGTLTAFVCLNITNTMWSASQWGASITSYITPSLDTWYHMALTVANSTWTMYRNGEAIRSGSMTTNTQLSKLRLGCAGDALAAYWSGWQQEYRFSNTSREVSWITFEYRNLMSSGNQITWAAREESPANLLPHYTRRRELSGGMLC